MVEIGADNIRKRDWNRFVMEQNGSFLQSYEWGEFQRLLGREVFFLRDINWQALIVKYQMPLGKNYLYCPHGPVLAANIKICGFLEQLQDLAKKEKSVFLRVEPLTNPSGIVRGKLANCTKEDLSELCFVKSKDIQPHKTLVLDLNLSEGELLAEMHEKTRYNIGLARRRGVTVKTAKYNGEDFNNFWDLLNQTARRQKIRLFGEEYYRKQLEIGNNAPHPPLNLRGGGNTSAIPSLILREGEGELNFQDLLFIAEFQDKPIAANMVNIFGGRATYLHGGLDNEYRSLMSPHLLQWEQIKYTKNIGCKIYDFWGCDEQKWPGVSRFKRGFGGREIEWCGTHDYIFDKFWYKIYKVARIILR
ncbi:MAG: peptidoglycan bridge formation glycyltransferase FemA/FemB family protein [bacterium]